MESDSHARSRGSIADSVAGRLCAAALNNAPAPHSVRIRALLIFPAALAIFCNNPAGKAEIPYEPDVVFTGVINDIETTLEGNAFYPNVCSLDADTVRMYLYSEDYKAGSRAAVSRGIHLRLYVLPPEHDSLADALLGIEDILFHFVRHSQQSETYELSYRYPDNDRVDFTAVPEQLQRSGGGRVLLTGVGVRAPALKGTFATQVLRIEEASISGRIRR